MSDNIRYSDFFITVNTHKPYTRDLYTSFLQAIKDIEVAIGLLFNVDDEDIKKVIVSDIGLETARNPKKRTTLYLHAHFVVEVVHSTTLLLGPKEASDGKGINKRLQEYFDAALAIEGTYCNVKLLKDESAAKNYARKKSKEAVLQIDDFDVYFE